MRSSKSKLLEAVCLACQQPIMRDAKADVPVWFHTPQYGIDTGKLEKDHKPKPQNSVSHRNLVELTVKFAREWRRWSNDDTFTPDPKTIDAAGDLCSVIGFPPFPEDES